MKGFLFLMVLVVGILAVLQFSTKVRQLLGIQHRPSDWFLSAKLAVGISPATTAIPAVSNPTPMPSSRPRMIS